MSDLISREALKESLEELKKSPWYCEHRGTIDGIASRQAQKEALQIVENIIDNAPTASPKEICIANIHFDKEQLQEIVDTAIIRCKDCKHQKKVWHEDKRMKEKGYWVYGCNLIDDSFVGTPVWGEDNQFCSSAILRGGDEE